MGQTHRTEPSIDRLLSQVLSHAQRLGRVGRRACERDAGLTAILVLNAEAGGRTIPFIGDRRDSLVTEHDRPSFLHQNNVLESAIGETSAGSVNVIASATSEPRFTSVASLLSTHHSDFDASPKPITTSAIALPCRAPLRCVR